MIRLAVLLALALVLLSERGEAQSGFCIAVEHPEMMDEPGAMLSASAATRLMLAVAKETQSMPMVVGGAVVFRGRASVSVFWRFGDRLCYAAYDPVAFERAFRLTFGVDG